MDHLLLDNASFLNFSSKLSYTLFHLPLLMVKKTYSNSLLIARKIQLDALLTSFHTTGYFYQGIKGHWLSDLERDQQCKQSFDNVLSTYPCSDLSWPGISVQHEFP